MALPGGVRTHCPVRGCGARDRRSTLPRLWVPTPPPKCVMIMARGSGRSARGGRGVRDARLGLEVLVLGAPAAGVGAAAGALLGELRGGPGHLPVERRHQRRTLRLKGGSSPDRSGAVEDGVLCSRAVCWVRGGEDGRHSLPSVRIRLVVWGTNRASELIKIMNREAHASACKKKSGRTETGNRESHCYPL